MALTPKKRAFIGAVREGASNKDAAIAAGCPEKTASAAGSRLAKDPDVIAELLKLNALHPVKAPVKTVKGPEATAALDQAPTDEPDPSFDLSKALRFSDPKDFLLATMNDFEAEAKLRLDAAKALMPFIHPRKGESGKKEVAKDKAAGAAQGKFGVRRGPLAVVK
ncbi:terminase [Pseudomonas sp. RIT-PI-a]|uniref:terminase n=1 Tax=Pseudomonas sp. RIT-PI-a TaxID=1681194 RepID=UPI00067613F8|nr:terminase [Pseudomonas sp. RIT-PI-a]KNC16727.1 terminase [Pseudomonas sp. RIT-PI-a]